METQSNSREELIVTSGSGEPTFKAAAPYLDRSLQIGWCLLALSGGILVYTDNQSVFF